MFAKSYERNICALHSSNFWDTSEGEKAWRLWHSQDILNARTTGGKSMYSTEIANIKREGKVSKKANIISTRNRKEPWLLLILAKKKKKNFFLVPEQIKSYLSNTKTSFNILVSLSNVVFWVVLVLPRISSWSNIFASFFGAIPKDEDNGRSTRYVYRLQFYFRSDRQVNSEEKEMLDKYVFHVGSLDIYSAVFTHLFSRYRLLKRPHWLLILLCLRWQDLAWRGTDN